MDKRKRLATVILPSYALIWFVTTGCLASGFLDFLMDCTPAELAALGLSGDAVFGPIGSTLPKGKRQEILSTTFETPFSMPTSELLVSGAFDPFSSSPAKGVVSRPRKLIVELSQRDADGKRLERVKLPLKIKGNELLQRTAKVPELEFAEGHELRMEVRPKGDALTLDEVLQIFFGMGPSGDAGIAGLLGGSAFPALGTPNGVRSGAVQGIATTRFGIDTPLPAGTVIVQGGFLSSASPGETRSARPRSITFFFDHLDEDGDTVSRFKVVNKVKGDTIEQRTAAFKGFAIEAGDSVRMSFSPKGGDFTAGDRFFLLVTAIED